MRKIGDRVQIRDTRTGEVRWRGEVTRVGTLAYTVTLDGTGIRDAFYHKTDRPVGAPGGGNAQAEEEVLS